MADASQDIAIAAIDAFIEQSNIDRSQDGWKTQLAAPPMVEFAEDTDYYWDIDTNVGNISIKLMPQIAPMHCSSTIYLARLGFYDGVIFHRVIDGFMAQGGDPLGRGTGGPGYQYGGEFSPEARHDRPGLLSMANAGPGTDGSQFFLTFVPTPHLDDNHSIFGEITEGMDTLQALEARGSRSGQTSEHLEMTATRARAESA
ncbi:MAG: peptidylprolyl isomerase [Myxococcota bacterium]|jgi:cyclophilin family peptidyl-prolyl cis-trans isomerase|nr:peptidylprolyl isomerase [Myxococcota bacterium]